MSAFTSVKVSCLLTLSSFLLAFSNPCAADSADEINGVKELATFIFKERYQEAYNDPSGIGSNWCFNVEKDPVADWIYFQESTGDLTPVRVTNSSRIQSIYKSKDSDGNPVWKYSSIFLYFNVPDSYKSEYGEPYGTGLNVFSDLGSKTPSMLTGIIGCMEEEDFIKSYFVPYVPVVRHANVRKSPPKKYVYWRFGNRTHRVVAGAMIDIRLKKADGTIHPAYMVVGYGGGAGP